MGTLRTLVSLAVVAMLVKLAVGGSYTVGGTNGGWDTATDLQSWETSQTFSIGDNLLFEYTSLHSVFEVTKADYDSCQTANPLQVHTDGTTIIPLSTPGKRYFICGTSGHCAQGMKLVVNTIAPSVNPPPPPFPSTPPPPSSPSTPPPASPVIPPPSTPSTTVPPSKSPSPMSTPSKYPHIAPSKWPSSTPMSSPTIPSTKSPRMAPSGSPSISLAPQPSPSSADKGDSQVKLAMWLGLGMMMFLIH